MIGEAGVRFGPALQRPTAPFVTSVHTAPAHTS